jgi:hypothetical protein
MNDAAFTVVDTEKQVAYKHKRPLRGASVAELKAPRRLVGRALGYCEFSHIKPECQPQLPDTCGLHGRGNYAACRPRPDTEGGLNQGRSVLCGSAKCPEGNLQ